MSPAQILPVHAETNTRSKYGEGYSIVFDASVIQSESNIPSEFIWPDEDQPSPDPPELDVPVIDLADFFSEDEAAISRASKLLNEACKKHGFFVVVNHGVKREIVAKAEKYMDLFFGMKLKEKQRAQRKVGESLGYTSSYTGRFNSNLPWKETFTFTYSGDPEKTNIVQKYIADTLGEDFTEFG